MIRWITIFFCFLFLLGCATTHNGMTKEEAEDERLMEMATGVGAAMGPWDGREYGLYTNDTPRAGWDSSEDAVEYDVKLVWLETGQEYLLGSTTNEYMDITAPRVGHFKVMVRACKYAGCDCTEEDSCSVWADSTMIEYSEVDGQPGVWRLYFELAPPSW